MTVAAVNRPAAVHPQLAAAAAALARCNDPRRPSGLLVLGGGYSGLHLARTLAGAGLPVWASQRRAQAVDAGIRTVTFDGDGEVLPDPSDLVSISHCLVTIPPDDDGQDPCLRRLRPLLARLPLRWLGYLSTTGVYGDTGGAWVHEDSIPRPSQPRSQARLACEQQWQRSGMPAQIFRLPAIYGPGRSPFAALAQGRSRLIHKPGQVFSRIHRDDIVGALLHNLLLPAADRPAVLNLADDCPCPSTELLGYAAHLMDCRLPELERFSEVAASLSPMALSFWQDNRRAGNRLLCRSLGYSLIHPSYREGLQACWREERQTPSSDASGTG